MALLQRAAIEWRSMKWHAHECVLVIAIVLITAQVFRPTVTGSLHYFSPDSLKSRYRSNEWLFGILPTYDPRFREQSSPLVDHLVTKGYWTLTGAPEPRWMVTGHFSAQWKDGQSWLHRVLYWEDEKWIAWTEANPQLRASCGHNSLHRYDAKNRKAKRSSCYCSQSTPSRSKNTDGSCKSRTRLVTGSRSLPLTRPSKRSSPPRWKVVSNHTPRGCDRRLRPPASR